MGTRQLVVACLAVLAAAWLATLAISAPQDYDREAYVRDYVRDLIVQLDQWTRSLPQAYDQALLKPPIDAGKLSPAAKAGVDELRGIIQQMVAMSNAPDLPANPQFKALADKAMAAAKETNEALGNKMRWPQDLESDWNYVRINLNYMARVYHEEPLPDLSPQPAGGRGGRRGPAGGAAPGAAPTNNALTLQGPVTTETVAGYVVDQSCAGRRGMWQNANCIETCIKGGDRPVLVTEDGKVYQISNLDKITATTYGKQVSLTGKTDGEVMVVDTLKLAE